MMPRWILILWIALSGVAFAGDNLKLNPKLDYTSDSQDGLLITGDHMDSGFVPGKPAQKELKKKYFGGYIPHVVVLDAAGKPLYNSSGEVANSVISDLLDKALR